MTLSVQNIMRCAIAGLIGCSLFLPAPAAAHLVTTGLGPVYDGIGHLLLTPEDLAPAIALSLYCGLRGAEISRFAIFIFPLAWLLGGLCGTMMAFEPSFPLSTFSFLLIGILVAADISLPLLIVAPMTVIIGFTHGVLNGIVLKPGSGVLGLVGIMSALFVLVTIFSAAVVSIRQSWARIVVRVIGSWVAASGLLMIGWHLKGILKG
jgi:hydrogenase/urease accessory protein HupE